MQTLNLIRKESGDICYDIIQFPDGEPHVVLHDIDRKDVVKVVCRIANPNDLFILMQVGDILNRQAVCWELYISYLMSMRMDRVIDFGESFSLRVVANVINGLNPHRVTVLEPHSMVTTRLIHRCESDNGLWELPDALFVFPDDGARKRYAAMNLRGVRCSKVRDTKTGNLSGFRIENPEIISESDKPLLVIDDLCDGGGTFAGIAAEIRKVAPDRKMAIYVTHMVNPRGIKTLSDNYDHVAFTNSYKDWQNDALPANVEVVEVV